MTQNRSADEGSKKTILTRRNLLLGLGGVGAGTLAVLDNYTDVLETNGEGSIRPDDPPLTNPNDEGGTDESPFQTPWNTDSLVVSVLWDEADSKADFLADAGYDELQNAVAFWNDYIESNAAFDLTLTFSRTHDNPDLLLRQATVMDACSPEYKSPASSTLDLQSEVCADTLRETPDEDDLPVTAVIGLGGKGTAVYRLVAQHAIGRLLGYDIWADPVSVMSPKLLTTPSHALSTKNNRIYHDLTLADRRDWLAEHVELNRESIEHPRTDTVHALGQLQLHLTQFVDELSANTSDWHRLVDELGLSLYADAYEETIEKVDVAYVTETITLVKNVLDTYTPDELAAGPAELDRVGDRIDDISNWPDTTEPYDLRVHRYFSDELWSGWAAEQTPTEPEIATDSA